MPRRIAACAAPCEPPRNRSLLLSTLCLALLATFAGALQAAQAGGDSLYVGFRNPPPEYDLIPLWSWNGRIDPAEGKRQIDLMMEQGIRRAIVYPFSNLRTHFQSEEWWSVWGEFLAYARQKGFQLGVNPEYEWPDGDARDKWADPPHQSLVLEGHPEYRMKRLARVQRDFAGPGKAQFAELPRPEIAIAAHRTGPDKIDGESLRDLSQAITGTSFSADLPAGHWLISFYYLENTTGIVQGLRIDPLNPAAVRRFIDLTLGEYYRRFKEYFGSTFTFVLVDSEGEYGHPIAWTPGLFEKFQSEKGYDLRKYLPLLEYEGGDKTAKIRIEYLRFISELYEKNYWGQIARWSEQHGLQMTAQSWSDSLHYDAGYGGDFMGAMRQLTMPGTEALGNRGRSPREFKEAESVAHFEGKRYWCEGALVLGAKSYIDPQKMRYSTNMLGLWGIDLWAPQFYFDPDAVVYPPEWFISQPYWKYFRHYTDYVRRISYMNGGGKHVADLLLYRPTDTIFANADPIFRKAEGDTAGLAWRSHPETTATDPRSTGMVSDSGREEGSFEIDYPRLLWRNNLAAQTEVGYFDLMELLAGYQRDFDVIDDHYLMKAHLGGRTAQIGNESFRGIILPPMDVISRASLSRIRRFYEDGGLVIGYGTLPSGSSEVGWRDSNVAADVRAIFGVAPGGDRDVENHNARGGRAYFVAGSADKVLERLDQSLQPDVKVAEGSRRRLLYLHRVKNGHDLYWIVNDTAAPRRVILSLAAQGKPELWNPETGERRETDSWSRDGRTMVPLELGAWDATYVVLGERKGELLRASVLRTNLKNYRVEERSSGQLSVEGELPAYAERAYLEGDRGGKLFRLEEVNDERVQPQVLSPENWIFRPEAKQVEVRYAREMVVPKGEGAAAGFAANDYSDQTWNLTPLSSQQFSIRDWWIVGPFANSIEGEGFTREYPPERGIDLEAKYTGADDAEIRWRRYHSRTPFTDLSKGLGVGASADFVAYAAAWVYSPREQRALTHLVIKNGKLWVNEKEIFSMYARPMYFEMRDEYGYQHEVTLKAGWNQVLVKVAGAERGGSLVFRLRFSDSQGEPVEGLITNWKPADAEAITKSQQDRLARFERWYRMEIPPGTHSALLPQSPIQAVYVDGREVKPNAEGHIEFARLDYRQRPVLTLQMKASEHLTDPVPFESGETDYRLGSWTRTGLTYYSGSATYQKEFELAPGLTGKRVVLDCGRVGSTAEIWLNGRKAGERLWEPFAVDVTKLLRPGRNQLKIVVTNASDAATRALPDFRRYLQLEELAGAFTSYTPPYMDAIGLNGLIGPVRLVPERGIRLSGPLPR